MALLQSGVELLPYLITLFWCHGACLAFNNSADDLLNLIRVLIAGFMLVINPTFSREG